MTEGVHPMRDAVIAQAREIQQIPAPTFKEAARANWVAEQMQEGGLDRVQVDSSGSVRGFLQHGNSVKPALILSAHMDTVFPLETDLSLRSEAGPRGERIYGAGIGDNALGLAALLAIPQIIGQKGGLGCPLWLCATTGEEGTGNLKGIWNVVEDLGENACAFISLEGMGLGGITHRGLGVERYRIAVETRGGHSWIDYGRPSAIEALVEVAAQLIQIRPQVESGSSFNIGRIGGGKSINTIAAQAWLELDLRSKTAAGLAELQQKLAEVVAVSGKKYALRCESIGSRPAAAISEDHWLVQAAARALEQIGLEPRLEIGSTEANAPLSRGYAAVTIGITQGGDAHTAEEFIDCEPVSQGLTQLEALIRSASHH